MKKRILKAKHSYLPFEIEQPRIETENYLITSYNKKTMQKEVIATLGFRHKSRAKEQANAEFITIACNSHHELKQLIGCLKKANKMIEHLSSGIGYTQFGTELIEKLESEDI